MNKKILFGLAAAGTASVFWACGDGSIVKFDADDRVVLLGLQSNQETNVENFVKRAISDACKAQTELDSASCFASMNPGYSADSDSHDAPSSSSIKGFGNGGGNTNNNQQGSDNGGSGNTPPLSIVSGGSSSSQGGGSQGNSGNGDPSKTPSSSSAIKIQDGSTVNWGTCAPAPSNTVIKKGEKADWKFTLEQSVFGPNLAMNSTFDWTFPGGNPATRSMNGIDGINAKGVVYAASGSYQASVKITQKDGSTGTVTCAPVEVTGAAVSGCTCTPTVTQVDIASANNEVGWNVTGCLSADGSTAFTYAWSEPFGSFNTASIAAGISAKGEYAPTVKVKNADNGLMEVTCGTIKAIDSDHPDFGFTKKDEEVEIPKGESTIIMDLPTGWNGSNSKCVLRCSDADANITITANGVSSMPSYSTTLDLDVSQTTGKTALLINLDFNSTKKTAKCKISGG